MGVERFLANAQFLRQIIHGHTAESVTKKVNPRSVDNSMPVRIAVSTSRPPFVCRFHFRDSPYHSVETNPVYLVSIDDCRYVDVSLSTQGCRKLRLKLAVRRA